MWQVILLLLLWMREELKVQQSICPDVELWSRRSRFKFPLLHCIVHVSLERSREAPTVTVTMPVVSLDDFSLSLSDSPTGEGNTPTLVHPTYDPGFLRLQFSRNV